MAFCQAEFKASVSETFENCWEVLDQLLRGVGGYANIFNILCALVDFDAWIEVVTDKAQKG